jgi:large subunit ribosomal protein L3
MEQTILGTKINMTQIFMDNGKVVPVTVVNVETELNTDLESRQVTVVGISKGKGFTGVMKKWGYHGAEATRGQSNKPRAPGSIGSQTPGRVRKGKKMAGRHGGYQITIKGLRIVKVVPEEKKLMISGPVPGARNSKLKIRVL